MHTQNCTSTIVTTNLPPSAGFSSWPRRVLKLVLDWMERGRQRKQLAMLNDAALKDIGLTRSDVQREITKTFWQP